MSASDCSVPSPCLLARIACLTSPSLSVSSALHLRQTPSLLTHTHLLLNSQTHPSSCPTAQHFPLPHLAITPNMIRRILIASPPLPRVSESLRKKHARNAHLVPHPILLPPGNPRVRFRPQLLLRRLPRPCLANLFLLHRLSYLLILVVVVRLLFSVRSRSMYY
jgi:hypothetical protein